MKVGAYNQKHLLTAQIRISIRSGIIHIKLKSTCIITIIPIATEISQVGSVQISVIV